MLHWLGNKTTITYLFWATVKTIALLGAADDLMYYRPRSAVSSYCASGRPQHIGAIVLTVAQKV